MTEHAVPYSPISLQYFGVNLVPVILEQLFVYGFNKFSDASTQDPLALWQSPKSELVQLSSAVN